MPGKSRTRRKKADADATDERSVAVETEVIMKDRSAAGIDGTGRPGMPLTAAVPVAHCYRCKRRDILVLAVIEGKMVGLCPDHFKLDVMTYVP